MPDAAAPVRPSASSVGPATTRALPPAALAFDAVAERFDERYGGWLSVHAQRRAVRAALAGTFGVGSHLLEIGGGTGEDACWLTARGRTVLLTDVSPSMVRIAAAKLRAFGGPSPVSVGAESLDVLADARRGLPALDGAYSNFAALNCVADLRPVASGLARLVRTDGHALLVLFGVVVPGEWVVQAARGDLRAARRRFARGDVAARLGGCEFTVRYHRRRDVEGAFAPWFRLVARRGVGIAVPPSAAEPWISAHPRLLRILESADRVLATRVPWLGDHVLYDLVRTAAPAEGAGA